MDLCTDGRISGTRHSTEEIELSEVKEMIRRHAGLQMKYKSELTAMREMQTCGVVYGRVSTFGTASGRVNEVQSMEELEQLLEGWN